METAGNQFIKLWGENAFLNFLVDSGNFAKSMMGPAIGVAVAYGLKAPPLVLFASTITGAAGATFGGPAGSFVAAVAGAEFGKAISRKQELIS